MVVFMSKKWKRILAVVLAAAFVFSSVDISGHRSDSTKQSVIAAEAGDPLQPNDADLSGDSGTEPNNTQEEPSTEGSASTEQPPSPSTEAENSTEQVPPTDNAGAAVGSNGNNGAVSGIQSAGIADANNPVNAIDAPAAAGDGTDAASGEDGLDADPGISTYALANPAASTNIPQNIADVVKGQVYYVRTYDDVLALQQLSYQDSLEGCIFEFARLNNTTNVWNLTDIGFTGLGNEDHPFRGRLQEYIDNGVTFTMSRPMFNYLGEGASLKNFAFNLNNCTSGIADYFIITDEALGGVTYEHVTLTGTVRNNSGAAGALYGTVVNKGTQIYEVPLDGEGLSLTGVSSVTGPIAGGYIGDVQGNVRLRVTNGTNVAAAVTSTSTAAGGLVGHLSAGTSLWITDEDITVGNIVNGTGSSGGIVGVCENASILSNRKVTRNGSDRILGTVNAGGFVGLIINSTTDISKFMQVCTVAASNVNNSYAGGIVGQYQADSADASLHISQVGVHPAAIGAGNNNTGANRNSGSGGVIGYINGSNVTITDIAYDDAEYVFQPQMIYSYSGYAASNTGGIAGMVNGRNITVSKVKLGFTSAYGMTGYCVGNVFGLVQEQSKIKLTDINVASHYISNGTTPAYNGGLIGYVDKGSVIALCGTIDLSGISYNNDYRGLYGSTKGYIAGGQTESILYLEEDAVYKKNEVVSNPEHSVWTEEYYGSSPYVNSTLNRAIDDVGNYGGLYRNVRDGAGPVIRYDEPYGSEVTGALSLNGGKYRIAGDADALRLALALNTFDAADAGHPLRFGGSCFAPGATADTLLAADYEVTGDLDFEKTGIFSLCRNDSVDYPFTGTMTGIRKGDGSNPTIRLYTISKQLRGGLFPKVLGASFANLKLEGKLYYLQNAGGLAAYSEGNLTVENVSTAVVMRTASYVPNNRDNNWSYGGMVGQHTMAGGTLRITDSTIAPEITNIRVQQTVGGAIGRIVTGSVSVSSPNIIVENVTIGSKLSAASNYMYNYGWLSHSKIAGLFADIGSGFHNNMDSWTSVGGTVADRTDCMLELTDIMVSGASVDASAVTSNRGNLRAMGGVLGYSWRNVEVDVRRDQKDAAIRVEDSEVKSNGHVGGLVTTLAGRLTFHDKVALDSLSMRAVSTESFCAFLVGDARNALITLKAADYILGSSSASGYGSNFDEIAGVTLELSADYINNNGRAKSGNYRNGGIVNILMPEFRDMTADTYRSYQNQVMSNTNNQYTRYYYNLFTDDYGYAYSSNHVTISGTLAYINSPEKLMLISVGKASAGNLNRFLSPYFDGADYTKVNSWNLSGDLDMNGYSYYPAQVSGGTYKGDGTAVLTLYGEDIENREQAANNKTPSNGNRQHYQMHAALFYNARIYVMNVENLTLRGTASTIGDYSAALIAGRVDGSVTVKDIVCDGIRLANYQSAPHQGLLLGYVDGTGDYANTTVTMSGITTTAKYDEHPDVLAAAALIGKVGDRGTNNTRVYFTDMKVEDGKEKVFKYASFIYDYDYVDNADINRSFGLYLFSKKDDTDGNVTYGDELKLGVNYSDQDRDAHLEDIIANAVAEQYNPYVYTVKDIYVNPRNGNLDRGCGTYEDPYIIDNSRQLMTLYCYLTGSDAYNNIFSLNGIDELTWKVNPIAGGNGLGGRCDNPAAHTAIKYGASGFPTRDELRQAYYLVTDDVDLSVVTDLNDAVTNHDFAGLGTSRYPFAGVIVGRKADGSRPAITLPDSGKERAQAYYGFIQYMQGAAVKDLVIQDKKHQDPSQSSNIYVANAGGGVAAIAVGGDNIIDHVAVKMTLRLDGINNNAANTRTGGYVGEVRRGTVLVRNVASGDLADYSVFNGDTVDGTVWHEDPDIYKKHCRMIGWVLDGAVLYEDTGADFAAGKATLEAEDFGLESADTGIPLSYSFPIVNEDHLNQGNGGSDNNGRIKVTGTTAGGFTLTLHDSEQLEIAAMALNAGAFSIYDSGRASEPDGRTGEAYHYNGYDHTAVCRKAAYSDLGWKQNGAAAPADGDFALATGSDDCNGHYPYFYYRYMDFSAVPGGYEATQVTKAEAGLTKRLSVLNWSNGDEEAYGGVSIGDAVTNYELRAGATYDLTPYTRSFRGFGALYDYMGTSGWNDDYYANCPYSMFRANFNGNGATVTFAMDRDWDAIATAGMFNNLITGRDAGFTIENMKLTGCSVHNESIAGTGVGASAGGLIAGYVKGVWTFADITVTGEADSVYDPATGAVRQAPGAADATVEATIATYKPTVHVNNGAGGLVGQINYISYGGAGVTSIDKQNITFRRCKIQNAYITGRNRIGGLVGLVYGRTDWGHACMGTIAFEGCSVQDSTVWAPGGASVGGFVGVVGWCSSLTSPDNSRSSGSFRITDSAVSDVSLQTGANGSTDYSVGGLVGQMTNWNAYAPSTTPTEISRITVDGLTAVAKGVAGGNTNNYGVGGIAGGLWGYDYDLADITVENSWIGYNKAVPLENNIQRIPAGGVVGAFNTPSNGSIYASGEFKNINVQDSRVGSYHHAVGGMAGICNPKVLTVTADAGKQNSISNVDVISQTSTAGGVLGSNNVGNANDNTTWYFGNTVVANSRIQSPGSSYSEYAAAGGIAGSFRVYRQNVNLENITVGSGSSISGSLSGGLVGYIRNGDNNTVQNITLSGDILVGCTKNAGGAVTSDGTATHVYALRSAGGLYGTNGARGQEASTADVEVCNTRIGAYSPDTSNLGKAGGIAGERIVNGSNNAAVVLYDHAVVKDCIIVANSANANDVLIRAGGLYGQLGEVNASVTSRICFYNPKLDNNSIGYAPSLDSLTALMTVGSVPKDVKLLGGSSPSAAAHWSDILTLGESNVGSYSLRIGNFVGNWNSNNKQLYVLRPELTYDAGFSGSRPAVDVGNNAVGTTVPGTTPYGYDYPYAYRRNCHIVYLEPDATDSNSDVASDYLDSTLIAGANNEDEYFFASLDSVITGYNEGKNLGETFLNTYKLNKYLQEYYNSSAKKVTAKNVPVIYADGGSAQELLYSIAGILTNVGGISNAPSDGKMTGLLQVSVSRAKLQADGKIVAETGTPSIQVNNNTISYREHIYDEENEDGSRSISLMKFRYGWIGADGQPRYETLYIPVFVVERITFFNTMSVMEGEQYSSKRAHDTSVSYTDEVIVAHDSTYTLFVEMAYSDVRKKTAYQDYTVAKKLVFEQSIRTDASGNYVWGQSKIPKGMKMTMVDASTGIAYYYTEEGNDTWQLDFTSFKDAQGNPYEPKEIGSIGDAPEAYKNGDVTLENAGLEQFYIYVDPSEVEQMENNVFKITASTDHTSADCLNVLDRSEDNDIQVLWIPGLNISLGEEGVVKDVPGGTYITGNISTDEDRHTVEIDGQIQITADQTYWDEKNQTGRKFIDSENNNKYLDVALYLLDERGDYVNLPEGTNIILDGGDPHVAVSQNVIYSYKDWGIQFPISLLGYDITGHETLPGDVNNYFHLTLDFSLANIDDYVGKDYTIRMELCRTADANYPRGDKALDSYEKPVAGLGDKDMAVALEVEDILDLGINTYMQSQSRYEIPFNTKLDFNNAIVNSEDRQICADRWYLVTYRLKKKVKNGDGYQYVPVRDPRGGNNPSGLHLGDELKLLIEDSRSADGYSEMTRKTFAGDSVYQVVKKFTADEIERGINGLTDTVGWDMKLLVDTDGIEDVDLSNYMVEVTVLPYEDEGDVPDRDDIATLVDYYIFTIGKIKTDM